jgi:prepilin-type N-terminal cleavage/methylation domain-containing protein
MKSPKDYPNKLSGQVKSRAGFTLIEIIVGLGILAIILSLGMFLTMDFYRDYNFRYQKNLAVSILQKARARSLANINQTPHGVHIGSSSLELFEGDDYMSASEVVSYPFAGSVTITGNDVVFDQVSGNASDESYTVSGNGHSGAITVNSEGRISWD